MKQIDVEKWGGQAFASMINIIVVWRRFLFTVVMLSGVISVIVAFVITPKFQSTVTVFPAERADLFGAIDGISSLVKNFSPSKGLASLTGNAELDRYVAILNSASVLGEVIKHFDLIHVYGVTSYPMEKTTKQLLENVEFSIEDEGYLRVSVFDEDPIRAANMANFFVDELNRTNSRLLVQNAAANKKFIETRYQKNIRDLATAEDSLKEFQKKYGVITLPEQIEATVKVGAELAAQLAVKEVQLGIEKQTFSVDHPKILASEIEISQLKKKISEMNNSSIQSNGDMKLLVPFANIPDLGSEYLRKYRDVELQYKILQFVTPLYEQSKLEEQRQTPSVIVLDRAFPAERKAKPKRSLIILGGTLIGLLSSIIYIGVVSRLRQEKEQNSELYYSLLRLRESIKSDLTFFSKK